MKKLISLILILCMACMLIPAMADTDVTGTWYASMMGIPMTMTLNADGTGTMISPVQGGEAPAAWTMEGDKITITVNDSPATGTVTADAITLEESGMEIVFTRDAVEAITVGEIKAAESVDAFLGKWAVKYMETDGLIMDINALGSVMPDVTIADGAITFVGSSEDDMFAAMYNLLGLVYTFEDGKLAITSSVDGANATGSFELLDDGMIRMTLDSEGNTLIFYYAPADTAEQPAA
ncbi:MAG: hypothetical protein IKE81_11155 [Clostridia bacterium]|nr:hypothetical protein [Clostridia bacterium]